MASNQSVDQLNSFLRGEISAVETYHQALEKVTDATLRTTLQTAYASHQDRVQKLTARVRQAGGTPAQGSGPWGTFAKLVEGGATALGPKAAIAALEEGEDHGRNDYRRDLDKLDTDVRRFVEQELLPAQLKTHDALSALKKTLS